MNKWYIINTKPHSEFKVISYLMRNNIQTFMPKLLVTRKHARKIDKVLRPLFPCYIFVYADIKYNYRLINNTIGVKNILSSGNEPSCVPKIIIDELSAHTDSKGIVNKLDVSNYDLGQEIQISEGIFKGSIGSFCGLSGKDRVLVFLEFLGKQVKFSISSLFISAT